MAENTMLYFRSVADEDNDDGAESAATNLTSLLIPASRLRAMNPTSDTLLSLSFDSIKNTSGADNTVAEVTVADTVALTGTTVAATYIHADITGIATDAIVCAAVHS